MDYPDLRDTARHLIRMADDPLTSGRNGHAAWSLDWLMKQDPMFSVLPKLIEEERARMRKESSHG